MQQCAIDRAPPVQRGHLDPVEDLLEPLEVGHELVRRPENHVIHPLDRHRCRGGHLPRAMDVAGWERLDWR